MSGSHPWIWGPIEGMHGLRLPPPPAPQRPPGGMHRTQFPILQKNPNRKPAYIFCLSLSNLKGRLPRKPAYRSLTLLHLNYGKKGLSKEVLESHRFTRLSNL